MAKIANYWKQFEGWVIGSKDNLFIAARLRLTVFYIALTVVILSLFSLFLYHSLVNNLNENLEGEFSSEIEQAAVISDATRDLKTSIFFIDLFVLAAVSVLSYLLAGKTLKPVQKSLEIQKQFSANASHELRTPLAIMKMGSEVALRDPKSGLEDFRKLAKSNLEEIERMSEIVRNLLLLSRSEQNEDFDFKGINLFETAANILSKMRQMAFDKNITLAITKSDSGNIFANAYLIEELVLNLLQNAISYTPAKGRVEVAIEAIGKNMNLTVADTGIGIEEKHLPRIFERFYTIDVARTRSTGGAGLGLSIVKVITDIHHGTIKIESELGIGTKVMVNFPKI